MQKKTIPRPLFKLTYFHTNRPQFLACPFSCSINWRQLIHHWAISHLYSSQYSRLHTSSPLIDETSHSWKYHVDSTIVLFFQYLSSPTVQEKIFSCNDDLLEKSIWGPGNNESRPIAASIEFQVCRIDVRILPSLLLSWTVIPGWLRMESVSRYLKLHLFKNFNILNWKRWSGSNLDKVYAISNKSFWESCKSFKRRPL